MSSHAPAQTDPRTASGTPGDHSMGIVRVSQTRVIRSEWTKLRSLRSTWSTLLTAIALMVGLGAMVSAVTASQYDGFGPAERQIFDPISSSLAGITFAQLAFGVLGVLLFANEYSTGMIRATLTAVPRRLPVLWAKLAVFAGLVGLLSLASSYAAFALGQLLLSGQDLNVALTDPDALQSILGAATYMTVAGTMGVAIGALLRNNAAAISAFVGVFFLLPPLAQVLPASISEHVLPYLPSNAGSSLFGGGLGGGDTSGLSAEMGLLVLVSYAAVVIAAAAVRLRSTDV